MYLCGTKAAAKVQTYTLISKDIKCQGQQQQQQKHIFALASTVIE